MRAARLPVVDGLGRWVGGASRGIAPAGWPHRRAWRQDSEDDHEAPTAGAAWGCVGGANGFGRRLGPRYGQQAATKVQFGGPLAVGEEAVMADAVEAVRQSMQQETADELIGIQGQGLGFATMTIVLPAEADRGLGHADKAAVGDGDTMRVASQIGQHLFGTAKGRFGVDDPLDLAQIVEAASKGRRLGQIRQCTEEAEFPRQEGRLQFCQEQTPEKPGEHAHRQEEAWPTLDPTRAIERGPTAGHDTVHMRMVVEILAPGVKHSDEPDLGAKMPGVGGDHAQRLGGGPEQHGVDHILVLESDLGQRRRQRKDNMEIGNRQQL